MSQDFGIQPPGPHRNGPKRAVSRYLVLIDSGGESVARLFSPSRELVAEFDASSEEVAVMSSGLSPARCAGDAEWDDALQGHSADERRQAEVYTLDV